MTDRPTFDGALERAADHARRHLESLDREPVSATASLSRMREQLGGPLPQEGEDPARVVDELAAGVRGGLVGSTGGRFFGWVIGGSVPAALGADWLASAWDQNAALYACSPAAAVVEEVCGDWLKELLGLPAAASFALVTGCQMAHVTALAAARHALLERRGWDVERQGLGGAPGIRLLTGDQRHGTVARAVHLLGLGTDSIVDLPVDEGGRLRAERLEPELKKDRDRPTIVLLQAGDLNIGAYDPFKELIPLAHAHQAWVHVDGAFGLWAAVSEKHRYLLEGAEEADSWATDGHKWLNVPYDCGYAFVADRMAHRSSMSHRASYLKHDKDARDQMDWGPEHSRRGRGFPTYAAIRQLGRSGIAEIVERTCRLARDLVTRLGALEGAEMLWEPQINQGLVRFLDRRPGATEADHDGRTDAVIAANLSLGEAFFEGTTWRGKRCMRVSVSNWQTNEEHVDRAVKAVRRCLEEA